MYAVMTGLTKSEARTLEQGLICTYTINALDNAINSISKMKWSDYNAEWQRVLDLMDAWYEDE